MTVHLKTSPYSSVNFINTLLKYDSKMGKFLNNEYRVRPLPLYLLTLVGLAICIISSYGYSIQHIPVSEPFGLLGMLPIGFWIGMGIMILSLAIGAFTASERVFFIQAMAVFVTLWGSTALFQTYPVVWDSYMHYNSSFEMASTGFIPDDPDYSYAYNYPGFFAFAATFSVIADPNVLGFLRFYPVFAAAFTLVAIYLFVRTYVPSTGYRVAFLVAAFVNVWLQFNFSPQSIGLAIGLLIFVCLERQGTAWKGTAVALFAFLTVSHPTTVLFVLSAVVAKEIISRIYHRVKTTAPPANGHWPAALFLIIWIIWSLIGAAEFTLNLTQFVLGQVQYLGFMDQAVQNQYEMRTGTENIFGTLYPQIRTFTILIFGLLTLIGLLIYVFNRKKISIPKHILPLLFIPAIAIPLDALFFNGQIYDRGILYLMLVAPLFFVPTLLRKRKVTAVLTTILVAGIVVSCASTLFYQQSLYTSSAESIAATDYLSEEVPQTYVIGGYYPYKDWGDGESYQRLQFSATYPTTVLEMASSSGSGSYLFDDTTELWYKQWGIEDRYDFYLNQEVMNSKVYDNGRYQVMFARGI